MDYAGLCSSILKQELKIPEIIFYGSMQNVAVWKMSSETAAVLHFFQVFSDVSSFVHTSMLLYVLEQI